MSPFRGIGPGTDSETTAPFSFLTMDSPWLFHFNIYNSVFSWKPKDIPFMLSLIDEFTSKSKDSPF